MSSVVEAGDIVGFTDDLIEEWVLFGRASGWSENTLKQRRKLVHLLSKTTGVPAESAGVSELASFLARYPMAKTRLSYWCHARSWFAWLKLAGYRDDDPTEIIKRPPAKPGAPRPVSDQQLADVLGLVLSARERAMVLLAAYAGLRVHEIAKIRGEDLDLQAGTLRVVGKGQVEAVLPLHSSIAEAAAGFPAAGWWFPSAVLGGHIKADTVSDTIHRVCRRAGHPNLTAHQFRHWYGTNVLRASGGNLRVAQECLRHSNPTTTAIYTKLVSGAREAAVGALPTL